MYVKWGSYQHADNECQVAISRETVNSAHGQPYAIKERWDIQGMLFAADVASLTTAIAALEAAYSGANSLNKDLGLYVSGGTTLTAHYITSANTINGTHVVRAPNFPEGAGAEYTTYRTYSISVEAEYLTNDADLIGWAETLTYRGTAGLIWGYLEPITGSPQQQTFQEQSTQWLVQQGYAIGNNYYPTIPSPVLAASEHFDQREVTMELPDLTTKERRVRWSYTMQVAANQYRNYSPTAMP